MRSIKSHLTYWIPTTLIALNWTFGGVTALLRTASSVEVFSRLGYRSISASCLGPLN
jgi:hypothetical protein